MQDFIHFKILKDIWKFLKFLISPKYKSIKTLFNYQYFALHYMFNRKNKLICWRRIMWKKIKNWCIYTITSLSLIITTR